MRRGGRQVVALIALCGMFVSGCGSTETLIAEQQKALTSITATVTTVCDAWLAGHVSTPYARTALLASAALLEQKRAKIAASPDTLTNRTIASLSESEQQLAQRIAVLRQALLDADATTVRQISSTLGSH